jgi:glyoxylase-like metal-dependent hydrolase (beta-lactamase superfamily II)
MLKIQTFCFNAFQENTYVLFNEDKEAIIIDPGCYLRNEQETIAQFILENNLTPLLLLNTHCHLDHVFGNNFISKKYGLTAHFHMNEQPVIDRLPEGGARWGVPCEPYTGPVKYIAQDEIINFGKDQFKVLFTPGHSPGSVCFYHEAQDFMVGGDLIFKDGVGRTDLPGCNPLDLVKSIQEQILPLPETMFIYPGHGPTTHWGREKKSNPYILHILKGAS